MIDPETRGDIFEQFSDKVGFVSLVKYVCATYFSRNTTSYVINIGQ